MKFEELPKSKKHEKGPRPASRHGHGTSVTSGGLPLFLRREEGSAESAQHSEGKPQGAIGAADDPLEHQADAVAQRILQMSEPASKGVEGSTTERSLSVPELAPPLVRDVLRQSGKPLDPAARAFFEPRFGRDLSAVRIHADRRAAQSARAIGARAYAAGSHLVFGERQYMPKTDSGRSLLAHELAHIVQHGGDAIRRTVEMRDVGRGEQSGFARLPELVERLNHVANGLVFSLDQNSNLVYQENPYGTITEFERQMRAFIDSATPTRLRLTNRQGLLGTPAAGYHQRVFIDDFSSGYVDIDDLLAANDLNLQTSLVHLIAERASVKDYTRRIGTDYSDAEFNRGHAIGLEAETQVLRDFFGDPTIRFSFEPDQGPFDRVWTNSRHDLIRERVRTAAGGLDALSMEVRLHDGRTMTAEQYRDLLAAAPAGANP